MNEERLKILEMLEKGIISASEAAELLSTIDSKDNLDNKSKDSVLKSGKEKFLRINITTDDTKVNVNIPITFIKKAISSGNFEGVINKSMGDLDDDVKDSIDINLIMACIEDEVDGEIVNIVAPDAVVSIRIE